MVVEKKTQWVLDMDHPDITQENINITESDKPPPYEYNYTLNLKYVGEYGKTYSLAHYSNWFTDDFKSHLKQFFRNRVKNIQLVGIALFTANHSLHTTLHVNEIFCVAFIKKMRDAIDEIHHTSDVVK